MTTPPWAAIRALMACRLMALDKQPGTRPVGIGEILRRLMAKCVVATVRHQATLECGNNQLCAGLVAGIEGAIHAMHKKWRQVKETAVLTATPTGDDEEITDLDEIPATNLNMEEDETDSDPFTQALAAMAAANGDDLPEDDFYSFLMLDAENGFNQLSRKQMLWAV